MSATTAWRDLSLPWMNTDSNTAKVAITQNFENALHAQPSTAATPDLLGYRQPEQAAVKPEDSFGFGDFVDMINPLQHIPVLNQLYRNITGDTIRSASRVIGGALFGGPLGAAGSLVNVVVEEETGKDITGNAIAFLTEGKSPVYKSELKKQADNPAASISNALAMSERSAYNDLPVSLLSFADMASLTKETAQPLHNRSSRYNA